MYDGLSKRMQLVLTPLLMEEGANVHRYDFGEVTAFPLRRQTEL